jgi:hypothetical protein
MARDPVNGEFLRSCCGLTAHLLWAALRVCLRQVGLRSCCGLTIRSLRVWRGNRRRGRRA